MLLGFDHLMLVVNDLGGAAADFKRAGFSVTQRHDSGSAPSENRLIVFKDGSYIEILYFADADYGGKHRLMPLLAKGEGWGDYSLHCDGLDDVKATMDALGIPNNRPSDYAKSLADGRQWSVALLQTGRGTGRVELPFIVEDLAPRQLRIPDDHIIHENGASGIAGVSLVTDDIDGLKVAMDAIYGQDAAQEIPPPEGAVRARRWTFNERFVDLVEPSDDPSELRTHLKLRGPSLYEIAVKSPTKKGLVDIAATHGGRIRLV